jgi:hypothetical protein
MKEVINILLLDNYNYNHLFNITYIIWENIEKMLIKDGYKFVKHYTNNNIDDHEWWKKIFNDMVNKKYDIAILPFYLYYNQNYNSNFEYIWCNTNII